ncbi:putative glycogen synthase kinase 3-related (gsk3) [Schistosoma mansoni]|uniref:putative glycogen synthase kinase 3-related (gsk3) n=1 Tax=Schistosoma mansoni TaxID=6183 RepID=UPI0001A63553|nr:putative glycogen synthase kinase 3-related (gsk3) [Schistosoma mansoni]|eukprot:XP_018648754.1 putative glycogen synthase kinase 3-related (gsk3) [Schistosoma mansoni]
MTSVELKAKTNNESIDSCLSKIPNDKPKSIWVEAVNCDTSCPVQITYSDEKAIGSGSFGVVYVATLSDDRKVAIKKVLQDKRYKNRELQILRKLKHCNIVSLYYYFYSTSSSKPNETYLNLIQEYIPQTLSRLIKHYWRIRQIIPLVYVKVRRHQLLLMVSGQRTLNILRRQLFINICIFLIMVVVVLHVSATAKMLNPDEPNVSYICSRYYRAPELIFGATHYTVQIDMWSAGCVIGELLLGRPLFPGESGVDQLVEIIKVLGTPTREQIHEMNPHYSEFKFPNIQGCSWEKLIRNRSTNTAAFYVLGKLLVYSPKTRMTACNILSCCFFNDLILPPPGHSIDATGYLPSGKPAPNFLNQFTEQELSYLPKEMTTRLRALKASKSQSVVNLSTLEKCESNICKKNNSSTPVPAPTPSSIPKSERVKLRNSKKTSHETLMTPRSSLQLPKGNKKKDQRSSMSSIFSCHTSNIHQINSNNHNLFPNMISSVNETFRYFIVKMQQTKEKQNNNNTVK